LLSGSRIFTKKRNDIQGLRGIAVLAVVFFHLESTIFSGGFLGVDIFFVISGFLITHILIYDSIEKKSGIKEFYVRRFLRLFPALLFAIAFTLFVGAITYSSLQFENLGKTSFHAVLSVSNILFSYSNGYFDEDSTENPLLHTWSLSVEEQFYLFWPVIILISSRFGKKVLLATVLGISCVSILLSQFFIKQKFDMVFFHTPFRAFEFGIGALLVLFPTLHSMSDALKNFIFLMGVCLMLIALVFMDRFVPMPGFYSLIPSLATALLILGGGSKLSGIILENKALTKIGDASYSIYLLHWPLIVFYKNLISDDLSLVDQSILVLLSLLGGFLSFYLIENTFRKPSNWENRNLLLPFITLLALTIYCSASIWATNGWQWRIPENIRLAVQAAHKAKEDRDKYIGKAALDATVGNRTAVLIGDSHSQDVHAGFIQHGAKNTYRFHVSAKCQLIPEIPNHNPQGDSRFELTTRDDSIACKSNFDKIINSDEIAKAQVIIIILRWSRYGAESIENTLAQLQAKSNAKLIIIGPRMEYSQQVPQIVESYGSIVGLNQYAGIKFFREERLHINNVLIEKTRNLNVTYIDVFKLMCNNNINQCPILIPSSGAILSPDNNHWTAEASKYFIEKLYMKYPEFRGYFNGE
jgi:peptidoglycan/LPS O-acetylase OafA/YrhL